MKREEIFRKLMDDHGNKIFRICNWYFLDHDERSDACQEVMIRLWQNLDSFKGASKLNTWVYRVTVNTCLTYIKKDKRRQRLIDPNTRADEIEVAEVPAEKEPEYDRKLAFFKDFMQSQGVADRTLISLYLEELSTREMAEITGLGEANVRVRIFRIKELIKKKWEEYSHGIG